MPGLILADLPDVQPQTAHGKVRSAWERGQDQTATLCKRFVWSDAVCFVVNLCAHQVIISRNQFPSLAEMGLKNSTPRHRRQTIKDTLEHDDGISTNLDAKSLKLLLRTSKIQIDEMSRKFASMVWNKVWSDKKNQLDFIEDLHFLECNWVIKIGEGVQGSNRLTYPRFELAPPALKHVFSRVRACCLSDMNNLESVHDDEEAGRGAPALDGKYRDVHQFIVDVLK
eukprot:749835-Hanusia_phi.AAC.1